MAVHREPRHERARPAVRHAETAEAVRAVLADVLSSERIISVEAALTDEGTVVNVSLGFPPERPLAEVHGEMSQIERQLRLRVSGVDQLRIDPEPVTGTRELQSAAG